MNAYLDGFRRAFDFKGRSTRSEFWLFVLFGTIASIVASLIDALVLAPIGAAWLATLVALVQFIPSLSVGVRRLHDTGRSGWWYLIGLVPLVGWIVLLVFFCGRSVPVSELAGAQGMRPSAKARRRSGAFSGAASGLGLALAEVGEAGASIAEAADSDDGPDDDGPDMDFDPD